MGPHRLSEIKAAGSRKARIIVNLISVKNLASAHSAFFYYNGVQFRAPGINRGAQTSRAGADDDQIVM